MTNRTFKLILGIYIVLSIVLIYSCRDREKKNASLLQKRETTGQIETSGSGGSERQAKIMLGEEIFFDASLSNPPGQSCATCHRPETCFTDTLHRNVSEGANRGLYGKRNALSVCYSGYVPPLHYDPEKESYVGGLFWDGRADSLAHQAGMPFLDLLEMGNLGKEMVVEKIREAPYFGRLAEIYKTDLSKGGFSIGEKSAAGTLSPEATDLLYACVLNALAAYQACEKVNPFSSRFDAYLQGKEQMSEAEARGYDLFQNKGMCAECHILEPDPLAGRILFTDHTYDNLGIPRDLENPYYRMPPEHNELGENFIDPGLGAIVGKEEEKGKFRVPTLRNIEKTVPYGHNGYFKTLEDIVHFYNIRDVGNEYPPAEYPHTVNKDELGNLGLTPREEADLVCFLKMLTDPSQGSE